ncbi:hypothetical protein [Streptomyces avicenniae]|uniref:hypothetical protein n=1 Tax=Streptomyces avicenniae TaxID=500153 RepID=UPI00069BB923|nr:hypothetical protein [Streptomyces avicenniae]
MSETTREPLSVHRLLPGLLGDRATFGLDDRSLDRVIGWHLAGADAARPTAVSGSWYEGATEPKSEFPSGFPCAPMLSRRLVGLLGEGLAASGDLLPVDTGDPEDVGDGAYSLLLVTEVVDCLDARRSSAPRRATGEIKKAVFRPEAVPTGLAAFRVPQYPEGVYWNGWAADLLTARLGDDLEDRLCWSEDPTRTPHPDPWAF